MVEDELRLTKQKLQMSDDDKKQDINLKTPEEVAKIIEVNILTTLLYRRCFN